MTELDVMVSSRLDYVGIGERFLGTDTTVRCSSMLLVTRCSRYSCTGKCSWRAQRNQLELWCGMPCAPSRLQRRSKGMEAILQLQFRWDQVRAAFVLRPRMAARCFRKGAPVRGLVVISSRLSPVETLVMRMLLDFSA